MIIRDAAEADLPAIIDIYNAATATRSSTASRALRECRARPDYRGAGNILTHSIRKSGERTLVSVPVAAFCRDEISRRRAIPLRPQAAT